MAEGRIVVVQLLFVAWLTVAAPGPRHELATDISSWSRLSQDAGYFTKSGFWKGGLWRCKRSTATQIYECLDRSNAGCRIWNVRSASRPQKERSICKCTESTVDTCLQWKCNTVQDSLANLNEKCRCNGPGRNGEGCQEWDCREGGVVSTEELYLQDYRCLYQDAQNDFCCRWKEETTSDRLVQSSVCECRRRKGQHCAQWRCKERTMVKCAHTGYGWCHLLTAVTIGGGMGLMSFTIGLVSLVWRKGVNGVSCWQVYILFVALCLPWSIGVLIWSGFIGLAWVSLLWTTMLGIALLFVRYGNKERSSPAIENPTAGRRWILFMPRTAAET